MASKNDKDNEQGSQLPNDQPQTPLVQPQTTETPASVEERKLDETIEGGLYIVNKQVVDANGKPVKGYAVSKDGNLVKA